MMEMDILFTKLKVHIDAIAILLNNIEQDDLVWRLTLKAHLEQVVQLWNGEANDNS